MGAVVYEHLISNVTGNSGSTGIGWALKEHWMLNWTELNRTKAKKTKVYSHYLTILITLILNLTKVNFSNNNNNRKKKKNSNVNENEGYKKYVSFAYSLSMGISLCVWILNICYYIHPCIRGRIKKNNNNRSRRSRRSININEKREFF